MRTNRTFTIEDPAKLKQQLLLWARQFEEVAWLDSNEYPQKHAVHGAVLAVEAFTALQTDVQDAFDNLKEYQEATADWLFGYLSYDLKNDTENLVSENHDGLDFPDLYFFQPKKLFLLKGTQLELQYLRMVDDEMEEDMEEILQLEVTDFSGGSGMKKQAGDISLPDYKGFEEKLGEINAEVDAKKFNEKKGEVESALDPKKFEEKKGEIDSGLYSKDFEERRGNELKKNAGAGDSERLKSGFKAVEKKSEKQQEGGALNAISPRISQEAYLEKVEKMLYHIQRGDIYEANFCQEYYAEDVDLDPYAAYNALNELSQPPFATFIRLHEHFLLSASPERYLKKEGNKVLSQPIKGTARRAGTTEEDALLKEQLQNDSKERSENIMIVDLVRNDLSKTAKKGTVEVEELCGIYSFKQVHQMISTVTAEVAEGIAPVELLRSTFPMGSMTGAPKISAMQLIEALEETRRGLYSGAVGYFTPTGDFDFNVVIRSILYNRSKRYVSFSVGGAITAASVPEKEYQECLLKAKAMREVVEQQLG